MKRRYVTCRSLPRQGAGKEWLSLSQDWFHGLVVSIVLAVRPAFDDVRGGHDAAAAGSRAEFGGRRAVV